MKTVEAKFIEMLCAMGMFETQAEKVMNIAKPQLDDIIKDYHITWDALSYSYPEPVYNVLMLSVKPIALEWIEKNIPEAWVQTNV